jgi:hypothetical protein
MGREKPPDFRVMKHHFHFLGIHATTHHGAFHLVAEWFPIHCAIATDGAGWRLLDGQHSSVLIHLGFYRMKHQSVLIIGPVSLRLDRKKPLL